MVIETGTAGSATSQSSANTRFFALAGVIAMLVYFYWGYSAERSASKVAVKCIADIDVYSNPWGVHGEIAKCNAEYNRHRPFWYDVYNPVG